MYYVYKYEVIRTSYKYIVQSAPAAPAPTATIKIPRAEVVNEIEFGAVSSPTAHVNITRDITLGFINFSNFLNHICTIVKYYFTMESKHYTRQQWYYYCF